MNKIFEFIKKLSLKDEKTLSQKAGKVITEFSIYDTKISHDFLWLNKDT